MGLESGTYIANLVPTWPLDSDLESQGAAHLRLIKNVLQNTFPNANGPGASIAVSDTPPVSPTQGMMWFDSIGAQLYVNYNDGNSSQWVVAVNNSPSIPVGAIATPLSNGIAAVGNSVKWAREDHVHPSGAVGVIDGSNAAAGNVGEYMTASQPSAGITNATPTTFVTLALAAGDWDVWGQVSTLGGATPCTAFLAGIGLATNSLGTMPISLVFTSAAIGPGMSIPVPRVRVSASVSTTVFLTLQCNFTPGAVSCSANIFARRVR